MSRPVVRPRHETCISNQGRGSPFSGDLPFNHSRALQYIGEPFSHSNYGAKPIDIYIDPRTRSNGGTVTIQFKEQPQPTTNVTVDPHDDT